MNKSTTYINLCKGCLDSKPENARYLGLTVSLASDCDKCGMVFGGKFNYFIPLADVSSPE